MGKNTFGKFFSVPFILISLPFLGFGLLIRFGLKDSVDILEKFNEALKGKQNES